MDKQSQSKNGEMGSNVFHRMIVNQIAGGIVLNEDNASYNTPRNSVHSAFTGPSCRAAACTGGNRNNDSGSPSEYVRDPGSILSLQPWIFRKSSSHNHEEMTGSRVVGKGKNLFDGFRDSQAVEVSPRSPGLGSGRGRGCGALKSRRSCRHLVKPLVETENSYIPQLYSEDFEIEECTFAPVPSPASVRPFVVTDGRRVISKSRYEPVPLNIEFFKEECLNGSRIPGSLIGITSLPELKKLKKDVREPHNARLGLSGTQRSSKALGKAGLRDQIYLFSAGITLGILSCCLSNKKELEALNGTLKRMENLVQDLQDELEMKEGLTVKELHNETSIDHEDNNSKSCMPDSEPMSKIEAVSRTLPNPPSTLLVCLLLVKPALSTCA